MYYRRCRLRLCLCWLAWTASLIAAYRVALVFEAPESTSNCFGLIGSILYPQGQGDSLAFVLLCCFVVSAYVGLALSYAPRRNKTVRIVRLLLILQLGNIGSSHASEEAQGPGTNYEIMGAISVQVPTNGHYVPYAALPFSIHVANRAWRLTIGTYNGSFFDYVSDGTNIVEVFHDIIRTNLSLPAVLHQDGFPADGGYANLVWLAYASSSHLDKGRTLPAPWLLVRHDPQSLMFKTEIERLPGSPGLPRKVVFITDKSRKRDALSHAATKIEGVSYKALQQRKRQTFTEPVARD